MAYKPTRIIDLHGRVVIPNHIREALKLHTGSYVDIALEDDGSIRIRAHETRCIICGESVEHKEHAELDKGSGKKYVCGECLGLLSRDMINKL